VSALSGVRGYDALFANDFEEDLLNLDWTVIVTIFFTGI